MTSPTLAGAPAMAKQAADLLLGRDHVAAIRAYVRLFAADPVNAERLSFNLGLARRRFRQERQRKEDGKALLVASHPLPDLTAVPDQVRGAAELILTGSVALSQRALDETRARFLLLEEGGDIRGPILGAVLELPCDEVHLVEDTVASLVWGLYHALVWDARIHLHSKTAASGQVEEAIRRVQALTATDFKAGPRSGAGFGTALRLLEPAEGRPTVIGRLLTEPAARLFAALGGWPALAGFPSPRLQCAAPAAQREEATQAPPARQGLGHTARLIGTARANVLMLERETAGFLRQTAATLADGADGEYGRTLQQFSRNLTHTVREIKDSLSRARSSLPESGAVSESAAQLQRDLAAQVDMLAALYPSSPYYRRLGQMVSQGTEARHLARIGETLSQVDLRRQGQVPPLDGPLVSVVMPAFNRAHLIGEAIQSVLCQSYGRFELLICDDASTDDTVKTVNAVRDGRIRLIRQDRRQGAAAARNRCLAAAQGDVIAYLDSDNIWHPRYLELALETLREWPGQLAAYAGFFDIRIAAAGQVTIRNARLQPFHLEDQFETPFIDLNSFVHSRRLFDVFGGFDEQLSRRQDYDLISRYCWSREPQMIGHVLNLYQRLDDEPQITRVERGNSEAPALISAKIEGYYTEGLPARLPSWLKKVSVLSWDMSRNHFAKAFCVADALSRHVEVELISFRFFEEEMFRPLAEVKPSFKTRYLEGKDFPDFFDNFARGVDAITGDAIYAVKPRLTSFGMGLLANYHTGKPLMLECNDLETVVGSAKATDAHASRPLEAVLEAGTKAAVPHDLVWSQVLDPLVTEIPVTFTHNINLNIHYRKRSLYMRNIKDDALYDPARYDRDRIRRELGFGPQDRVILFGGLVRKHKGIFELIDLLDRLNDPRYKLLVVGSRETPDLRKLGQQHRESIVILPPQSPERMAEINLAADLVILWFDPAVPAGNYQSPYKMSDALAMGPSIIGSPTSDLADFARRRLLWNVAFGDSEGLVAKIHEIFADPAERQARQARARAFFQREFSYKSVLPAFALGASGLQPNAVYPAAERFAAVFAEFERRMRAGTA